MTKKALFIGAILCFLSAPLLVSAYSSADALEAPPVAQALVREGDFAVRLADALKLGSPAGEVEAMSALAAAGVAPQNGWIADYPITPEILGELESAVADAADSGRLTVSRDEALVAFRGLAVEFDLAAVAAAPEGGDLQGEPPKSYSLHSDPAVVHNHYYSAGPPVVTYYPPPSDYFYLYAWVPYPFYWHSVWFPGFYILHDFNRVVFVRHRTVKVVSNHVFVPRTRKFAVVDHRSRVRGRVFEDRSRVGDRRRFDSPEARRGAASIVERSGSSFQRPSRSEGGARSFSSPSLRRGSGGSRGGFRLEMRGSGVRGGSARSGSSAGSCRGRC